MLEYASGLWGQAVDPSFGQVETVVVARREVVCQHQDSEKEQRIESGTGSILGRTLTQKGPQGILGRGQVENDR